MLDRPFHGVRAIDAPDTFRAVIDCCVLRMKPHHRFVGRSAMRLWGLPVARGWRPGEPLQIAVPRGASPPRTAGLSGRRLDHERARTWIIGGAPVVDPVAAVFTAAGELSLTAAVVALDALITTADNYPGLVSVRPLAALDDVRSRMDEWGRFCGCGTIRAALEHVRERVESPKETETRLLITASGFAEPVVQHEVRDGARLVARVDLAYPEMRIAIEYEGDGHRTDKNQWRRDIRRQRDLEDRGWIVIRLTEHDLVDGGATFLDRLRGAIAARTRP